MYVCTCCGVEYFQAHTDKHNQTEINRSGYAQKKKQIVEGPRKRKTRKSLIKLKFFNCNFISCDFQILDSLLTPKCFRKVFLL